MFTKCTACGTWFRVSQESLHAVHGLVRCGNCGTVFSALGTLLPALPEEGRGEAERQRDEESGSDAGIAEALDWAEPAPLPETPAEERFRWIWRAAAGALFILFAAQLVHAARDTLARWPVVGGAVTAFYRTIGQPLVREPILADYRIEEAALTGTTDPDSALGLSGLLRNSAGRAQALPLVDLKLMDRYGHTVAARLLTPQEYGAGSRKQLGPNLSMAFHVKLADPGSIAVGFALSLCKRSDDGVRCQPF